MITFRSPFSKTRIDPKPAVPTDITEQHPWHWNPQETNHNDANGFVGKVDFDWEGLAEWSIDFCNRDLTPQKWWRFDYEEDAIYHANENVNNMPIKEQAFLAYKNNTHSPDNSCYFKIANEEFGEWEAPLRKLFPQLDPNKLGISLFLQPPGHTMYSHVDTYSSFIRRTGDERADYSKLRRYMIFVTDWDWGQFFHHGNHVLQPWQAGDCWDVQPGVYHGSANCGLTPKMTIHWSGELVD